MRNLIALFISCLSLVALLYLYWRFFFFFRNPERITPKGANIVSPADGTVVYVARVDEGHTPISMKKKRRINLDEILKTPVFDASISYYHIGIFMHPTSVHVNRTPISGKVKEIFYSSGRNLPMTLTWWRVLLRRKPFEKYADHLLENERNTILIEGSIPVWVVQIADIYVRKIESWVSKGDTVEKGQRIGMIKMGSQVDIVFPAYDCFDISVSVGQKVKAGETIVARDRSAASISEATA